MFVPLFAVPLAVQLIAAAWDLPKLDVTASCKGAAEAGYAATTKERLQNCVDSEHRTRDQLGKNWSNFPVSSRTFCLSSIAHFAPTYTELATCLEIRRDLANPKPPEAGTNGMAPPRQR
jgi:hypothetical protein